MCRRLTAVLVVILAVVFGHMAPVGALSKTPTYPGDFPDPAMMVVGGSYWAYSTGSAGRNLQVMQSADLQTWPTTPTDPLPLLPSWATVGSTWAPSVVPQGDRYRMYYTVRETSSARQCVSVASASTPGGPFTDISSGPLVCQLNHLGSIDPSVLTSGTNRYLLWKSDDNAAGGQTHLWAQQLSDDGLSLTGTLARLLDQTEAWQRPAIEGPDMIAVGTTFYLFYGAGDWASSGAGIGYAICSSPLGPCINQSTRQPWLDSRPRALGPSGPSTFTDLTGMTRLAYHAWTNGVVGYPDGTRALFVDQLSFKNGRPVLS
jgi:beta-xylosidase